MANPYHDETGKFCSRDGMGTAIHKLALAGRIPEYLALKKEYDEIEKDNVVVPQELFSKIVHKAQLDGKVDLQNPEASLNAIQGLEQSKTVDTTRSEYDPYRNLDSSTLATMVEDWSYRTDDPNDGDFTEDIQRVVEVSKYDRNVLYAALRTPGLSFDHKVSLAEHYKPYYSIIAEHDVDKLYSERKVQFFSAIEETAEATKSDSSEAFNLDDMVSSAAEVVKTSDELDFLASTPYEQYRNGHAGQKIMDNPALTKDIAVKVLDKASEEQGHNYQGVRWGLESNLRRRGVSLPKLDLDGYDSVPPIAGRAPEAMVAAAQEYESLAKESKEYGRRRDYEERAEAQHTLINAYAENQTRLKAEIRNYRGNKWDSDLRDLKMRLQESQTRLGNLADARIVKDFLEANKDKF